MTHQSRVAFLVGMALMCTAAVPAGANAVLPGDVDGNGVVVSADLRMLKELLAEILTARQVPGLDNIDLDPTGRLPVVNLVGLNLMAPDLEAGNVYEEDPIVGSLHFAPAGTFTQGSPASEPCRNADETQFTHTLTRSFAVMATEVTRQMWADLQAVQPTLPADPTTTSYGAGQDNPVQNITWHEAVLFANLLSEARGLARCYYKDGAFTQPVTPANYTSGNFYWKPDANGFRLLSEGEWEYACRAGTITTFYVLEPDYSSGNCANCEAPLTALSSVAWWCGNNSGLTSYPAGLKTANPWRLYDTLGNVSEWCWDCYGSYPPGSAIDYKGNYSHVNRVYRGATWAHPAGNLRAAYRGPKLATSRENKRGFRLARLLP